MEGVLTDEVVDVCKPHEGCPNPMDEGVKVRKPRRECVNPMDEVG